MNTSQIVTAVTTLVSAVLAVLGAVDPGGVLARPDIQAMVVGVFTAAVPLGVYLWTYFHHDAAKVAALKAPDINKLRA